MLQAGTLQQRLLGCYYVHMNTNRYRASEKPVDAEESERGKRRMEAYLSATQAEFEAAVKRASRLNLPTEGVLAGHRVRGNKDVQSAAYVKLNI
jgi:hypothetical protein